MVASFYDRNRFVARLQQEDIDMETDNAEIFAELIFDTPLEKILRNRQAFIKVVGNDEISQFQGIADKIPQVKPALSYILGGQFLHGQLSLFPETDEALLPYGKGTDLSKTLYNLFLHQVVPGRETLNEELLKINQRFRRTLSQHYPSLFKLFGKNYSLKVLPDTFYKFEIETFDYLFPLWEEKHIMYLLRATLRSSPLFRRSTIDIQYVCHKTDKDELTLKDLKTQEKPYQQTRTTLFDFDEVNHDGLIQKIALTPNNKEAHEDLMNFFYDTFGTRPGKHRTLTILGPDGSGKSSMAEYAAYRFTELFPHKKVSRYTTKTLSSMSQKAHIENQKGKIYGDNNPYTLMKNKIFSADILIIEGAEQLKGKYTCSLLSEFAQQPGKLCIFVVGNQSTFHTQVTKETQYKEEDSRIKEYHELLNFSIKLQLEHPQIESRKRILVHHLKTNYSHITLTSLQLDFILDQVKDIRHYSKILLKLGRSSGEASNQLVSKYVTNAVGFEYYLPYESINTYLHQYFEDHKLWDQQTAIVTPRKKDALLKKLSGYIFKKMLESQNNTMTPDAIAQQCGVNTATILNKNIGIMIKHHMRGTFYSSHLTQIQETLNQQRNEYLINRPVLV